ncbi:MAG: N-acetylmuramoyl-L-alanine amidase [Alphaproteobacteria bacterium]
MHLVERPSPNHNARREGAPIDLLLLHYTGMVDAETALARLCDPAAKVSAHYTIDEAGTVYRHVDESARAWHAGVSYWAGERDINTRSIGIELVNPGHDLGYRPFPRAQMEALVELARGILARHKIPAARVLAHSDVAPGRKVDPGEKFDWADLARQGIGLFPAGYRVPAQTPPIGDLQTMLARFGYGCPVTGIFDDETRTVLSAFQRHYRPHKFSGNPDADSAGRIEFLLDRAGL